jgi:hypothetical protein
MNGILITWQQLFILGVLVVGVYVAELWLFMRKSAKRQRGDGDAHRRELDALRFDIAALQDDMAALEARAEAASRQAVAEPESPYSQAIKLAKQGLDSNAVASGCGISRGEAELIVALYRAASRP